MHTCIFLIVDRSLVEVHNQTRDEDQHVTNSQARIKGRARRVIVEQDKGCTPITTYPSYLP